MNITLKRRSNRMCLKSFEKHEITYRILRNPSSYGCGDVNRNKKTTINKQQYTNIRQDNIQLQFWNEVVHHHGIQHYTIRNFAEHTVYCKDHRCILLGRNIESTIMKRRKYDKTIRKIVFAFYHRSFVVSTSTNAAMILTKRF